VDVGGAQIRVVEVTLALALGPALGSLASQPRSVPQRRSRMVPCKIVTRDPHFLGPPIQKIGRLNYYVQGILEVFSQNLGKTKTAGNFYDLAC